MSNYILADGEYRLLSLIWDHTPIPSGQLVRLCEEEFGWKKSTTYTQVRRLADKGLLQNEQAVVTPLVTRIRFSGRRATASSPAPSEAPCPALWPHSEGRTLSESEAEELKTLIDQHRG